MTGLRPTSRPVSRPSSAAGSRLDSRPDWTTLDARSVPSWPRAALWATVMLALGLAMMAIYGYVFFACYAPFNQHVAKQQWKDAGDMLGKIRKLIAVNLALGLLTVCVAVIGAAWA